MHHRSFVILSAWVLSVVAVVVASLPLQAQTGEVLYYYTLRFEFATTSDWTTLTIDSGPLRDSRLVSQSQNLLSASVARASANMVQPIDNAVAGQEVSIVFDSALAPEAFQQPFDLRIDKGHLGGSRVRIYNLLPSGPVLLGEYEHDGVVPDAEADLLPNIIYLSLDFSEVLQEAPYQLDGPNVPKMAWAFYFPWYKDADWASRQNLKDVPLQPYNSQDAVAIARHIDQAQGAGIGGFIASWQGPGSYSDQALPVILQTAEQKNFAISVLLETLSDQGQPLTQPELARRLIILLNNYGPYPAFMKVDGRPVVFVADAGLVPTETWSTVFALVRAQGLDGFFLGEGGNQDYLDVFDSLYTYTVTDFGNLGPFVFAVRPASRYRHFFADNPRLVLMTATVQPGYDDELLAAPGQAKIVDRQNGLAYQSVIDTVVYREQEWILISTWNQFYENTHIEPSELYGDQYLRLTADMITEWLGPRPTINPGGIVNSASYRHNNIAPGEIVTIFGEGIGPEELCTMQVDGGFVTTTLCDTEVTFNGNPAPILYARSDVVSAVAPLAISQANVRVQVKYRGVLTAQSSLPVYPAVPGIYTLDSSGTGQAAAQLWPDYSVNGPANPADRGSTIMVYMTAGGPTDPPGEAGAIVSQTETLQLPVRAEIGGVPADVGFVGSAPDLIKGALRVNIEVPENAPTGDAVSLVIWVANVRSQDGVTLAVK